ANGQLSSDHHLLHGTRMDRRLEERRARCGKTLQVLLQRPGFRVTRDVDDRVVGSRIHVHQDVTDQQTELRHAARGAAWGTGLRGLGRGGRVLLGGVAGRDAGNGAAGTHHTPRAPTNNAAWAPPRALLVQTAASKLDTGKGSRMMFEVNVGVRLPG